MKTKIIAEGKAKISVYEEKIVSKEMPVFYNPLMKFNRDMSVLLLNAIEKKDLQIGDPLAGSGVRAARLLTELKKGKIKSIMINDLSKDAVESIKENILLNKEKINCKEIGIQNKDANLFVLESQGFDYIDIDPFGSPNFLLDSSMERISRGGILAVTATDTAALCGTYPLTCKRKYFATPLRNEHMHELGLRILVRKVQLIGAQYEKAMMPIFSYYKDHYFRAFFLCEKSKTKCDETIKRQKYFHYCRYCLNFFTSELNMQNCCEKTMETAGPLWAGSINDSNLLKKIIELNKETKNKEFLETMLNESEKNIVGFFDLHRFSQKYKVNIPRTDIIIQKLRDKGFFAEKTIFDQYGIRTDAKIKEFAELLENKRDS